MNMRFTACFLLLVSLMFGQGTETKPKPEDYPVSGIVGDVRIGADYVVQSVSSPRASFIADKFLVVDIGVYPPPGGMTVSTSVFALRINGKDTLMAQTPGMVAAGLKYPDWERQRGITAVAGPLIIGRRTPVERFPGDTRPAQSRLPGPVPRAPADASGGSAAEEPVDVSEVLNAVSLPEGPRRQPVSGYVFFPYRGKLTRIRKVELIVQLEESQAPVTLRLR